VELSLFDEHFGLLRSVHPRAESSDLGDGAQLVSVPHVALDEHWSKSLTTVRFIAPKGYSVARPDSFWVDGDLSLAGGGKPRNSGENAPYPVLQGLLWFSYHLSTWNPSADNLLTYLQFVKGRLREPQ
jgi:hypothetical protein